MRQENTSLIIVYFLALISIIIWASVYSVTRVALQYISAGELAFLRLAIASIVLFPYAIIKGESIPKKKYWKDLFLIGAIGFASYTFLLNLGQTSVGAGT